MFETILEAIYDDMLKIVITIISTIVGCYIIPAIKKDLVPWLKEQRIYSTIKKFVKAAEKLADSGAIQKIEKKQYVIDLLAKNGIIVNDVLDAFIESAVEELDAIISVTKDEILKEETVEKIEP